MPLDHELTKMQDILDQAENERSTQQKGSRRFVKVLSLLESYREEHDTLTDEEVSFISNLRISHCRQLLFKLPSLADVNFEAWFLATLALGLKLKPDVDLLIAQHKELADYYDHFFDLYRQFISDYFRSKKG